MSDESVKPLASPEFIAQMRAVQKHLIEKNVYAILGVTHYVDHVLRSKDGKTFHITLRAYDFEDFEQTYPHKASE